MYEETLLSKFLLTNEEDIVKLFLYVLEKVKLWMFTNGKYSKYELPDEFSTEVALECVSKVIISHKPDLNLDYYIKDLCQNNAKKHISQQLIFNLTNYVLPEFSREEDKLEVEEIIETSLQGCDNLKLKVSILYFFLYGNLGQLNKISNYYTDYEFTILSHKVINMTKELNESNFNLDMYIPTTPIGKTILLSILLNKYPKLSSLLILLKDFKKFFQFIIVNEKDTFNIPPVLDFTTDIVEISQLIERMEGGENTVKDLEMLKDFLIESDKNFEVCKTFSDFVLDSFRETLDLYKETSMKTIKQLEGQDISKAYELLNKQMAVEYGLLKSINDINSQYITNVLDTSNKLLLHISF